MEECIAIAEAFEAGLGYAPVPDEAFVRNVQGGHRRPSGTDGYRGVGLILDSSIVITA
jgi:hypothetical protein